MAPHGKTQVAEGTNSLLYQTIVQNQKREPKARKTKLKGKKETSQK